MKYELTTKTKDYYSDQILKILDRIEGSTGNMAHEIHAIKYELAIWQDGNSSDEWFLNFLNKYLND